MSADRSPKTSLTVSALTDAALAWRGCPIAKRILTCPVRLVSNRRPGSADACDFNGVRSILDETESAERQRRVYITDGTGPVHAERVHEVSRL